MCGWCTKYIRQGSQHIVLDGVQMRTALGTCYLRCSLLTDKVMEKKVVCVFLTNGPKKWKSSLFHKKQQNSESGCRVNPSIFFQFCFFFSRTTTTTLSYLALFSFLLFYLFVFLILLALFVFLSVSAIHCSVAPKSKQLVQHKPPKLAHRKPYLLRIV